MVSIDTVYQRVLVLANKEQRGYITPQEFNLLANHAQMEIFEQYFYDINQFNRVAGNTQEYSDMLTVLYEKIALFEEQWGFGEMSTYMSITNIQGAPYSMRIPADLIHKLGTVSVGDNRCEMLNSKDFDAARLSPLTSPTLSRPIACLTSQGLAIHTGEFFATGRPKFITWQNVSSIHSTDVSLNFIKKPDAVNWAYVIINDKPLYNYNISKDFSLHGSEETELVYKILKLAGVNLKAQEVVQVGQTLEQTQIQQEKQ